VMIPMQAIDSVEIRFAEDLLKRSNTDKLVIGGNLVLFRDKDGKVKTKLKTEPTESSSGMYDNRDLAELSSVYVNRKRTPELTSWVRRCR